MKTIKGPGIFLAQFADDLAPFNSLEGMAHWAAQLGLLESKSLRGTGAFLIWSLPPKVGTIVEEVLGVVESGGTSRSPSFHAFAGPNGRHQSGV